MPTSKNNGNISKGPLGIDQNIFHLDGDLWVKRITLFCFACALIVGAADLFLVHLDLSPSKILARSFDISMEESLGTWFSSAQALLVGLVAAAILVHSSKHDTTFVVIGWGIVALFFIFISLDDTAKFHERLGTALRLKYEQRTDIPLSNWFPSYGWQLFIAPFFMAMGVFVLWFLWNAVAAGLRIWVLVALSLFGIAVGLDFIEGLNRETMSDDSSRHLMQLSEEVLEMLGTTTFLFVFLSTLNSRVRLLLLDTCQ
jgi:hypothetical protein